MKQKRLFEIWFFFYRRENDLINQEIRTIRVLDELKKNLLMMTAEIFFNQIPELNIEFFQILDL